MMPPDTFALLLLALLLEACFGYPAGIYARIGHPVTWIGALIGRLDRALNREGDGFALRRGKGVFALLAVLAIVAGMSLVLTLAVAPLGLLALLPLAILASTLLAQRSLHEHVAPVAAALDAEGLAGGRREVAMIVGRNPASLDEAGVARAAIESLSENFSDGVVAPAFWLGAAGLPGIALYKAINTADSMIGHKSRAPSRLRLGGGAA